MIGKHIGTKFGAGFCLAFALAFSVHTASADITPGIGTKISSGDLNVALLGNTQQSTFLSNILASTEAPITVDGVSGFLGEGVIRDTVTHDLDFVYTLSLPATAGLKISSITIDGFGSLTTFVGYDDPAGFPLIGPAPSSASDIGGNITFNFGSPNQFIPATNEFTYGLVVVTNATGYTNTGVGGVSYLTTGNNNIAVTAGASGLFMATPEASSVLFGFAILGFIGFGAYRTFVRRATQLSNAATA